MKRLILITFAILAIIPIPAVGQTFHAIIFANTKSPGNPNKPGDTGIGPSVTVDFQRMGIEMTTIAKSIGYTLKKYYYYGTPESFSRNSLERVLNNLTCAPNDIVFFFYSGHGGRAENERTDFPEMVLKVPYGAASVSQLYPLYDVYTRIKSKSPRLTIVMGDLCNSVMDGFYRSNDTSKGATVLSKGICDVYKNLFLNVKGGLIAASSKPGETSGCALKRIDDEIVQAGGYLTCIFLDCLQYCVSQGRDVSWKELLDNTITLTREFTDNKQTPIYLSELAVTSAPSTIDVMNTAPQVPTPSNDAATDQRDNLAYALSMVGNQNVAKLDRIRNITKAKSYFANTQARLQVVGFDNKTIVNTCSAESYLNYLSIATNMESVVVLDTQKDASGKVTYARVHEIHYK